MSRPEEEKLDAAAVAKYERQLDDAFNAVAEGRECSCTEADINPFCKTHDTGPTKRCSECRGHYTGQHFCYGTYPG